MRKGSKLFLMLLIIFIISSVNVNTLSLSGPFLSPAAPENRNKNNPLLCYWQVSSDTTNVVVKWYNSSNLIGTQLNPYKNQSTLNPLEFFRGETINCSVNITNGTHSTINSISTIIKNAEPIFQVYGDETLYEDNNTYIYINATDADNDKITYSYTADINFTSFDNETGDIYWKPVNASIGNHFIRYQAVDDQNGISQIKNVTFTVIGVNDAPSYTTSPSLPFPAVLQNETLNYSITAVDEETNQGPFNFSVNSSYYTLHGYEAFNITTIDDKTGYLNFIYDSPLQRKNGTYIVTMDICVEDENNGCNRSVFNITVESVNFKPNITGYTIGSWNQGDNFTFYINATDLNPYDDLSFIEIYPAQTCESNNPWSIETLSPNTQNATGLINITELNNSHVDCKNITIRVSDGMGEYNSVTIDLDINNTNDAPVIHQNSFYPVNSLPDMNYNITNLTAVIDLRFLYRINMTDPDLFIEDWNETHNFNSNSSLCSDCPIFSLDNNGTINLTITDNSYVNRMFSYEINVTDKQGSSDYAVLNLFVRNNSYPYFIENLSSFYSVGEDLPFYLKVNASDDDPNDSVNFSDNIGFFDISQTGLISFTPNCSYVDSHAVRIKINDSYGANAFRNFTLNVTFQPDTPSLINFSAKIIEELDLTIPVFTEYVIDEDLSSACINQTDILYFNYSVPSELSGYFTTDSGLHQEGNFHITPPNGTQGKYVINITVTDSYNLTTFGYFNLTIYNMSRSPVIYNITPGNSSNLTMWLEVNETNFPESISGLGFSETVGNVTFNHTSTDPDGDPLIYTWYLNGSNSSNNHSYIYNFDYNSSGNYNFTLIIGDNVSGFILHNISFTWLINVTNANRLPYLTQNFSNITLGGSYSQSNYFTTGDSRFVDPDGDSMNFSVNTNLSNLSHVDITINNSNLYIIADSIGEDTVVFSATDGISSVNSNNITINVTWIAETPAQTITETLTSSNTRTITQTIIQEVEKETPIYLDILSPEPVTVYINDTIRAPISLINKGNITLKGIQLSAETNNSYLNLSFSDDYFPQLVEGQEVTTDLIITSYKTFNNYEINVYANITDPDYSDVAVIYVNSLEKGKGNRSVTNTKITFARDLLSNNPECLELNEFLNRAKAAVAKGEFDEASKMIDAVVEGCKYLVSQSKLRKEQPATGLSVFEKIENISDFGLIIVIVGIISLVSLAIFALARTRK
ncbi:hypothetical protein GF327_00965 [Candidatus Woesearchaeota archaeon]|nr:hypothetical protein [Candidatus Woesearchaeota archaeon]